MFSFVKKMLWLQSRISLECKIGFIFFRISLCEIVVSVQLSRFWYSSVGVNRMRYGVPDSDSVLLYQWIRIRFTFSILHPNSVQVWRRAKKLDRLNWNVKIPKIKRTRGFLHDGRKIFVFWDRPKSGPSNTQAFLPRIIYVLKKQLFDPPLPSIISVWPLCICSNSSSIFIRICRTWICQHLRRSKI